MDSTSCALRNPASSTGIHTTKWTNATKKMVQRRANDARRGAGTKRGGMGDSIAARKKRYQPQ